MMGRLLGFAATVAGELGLVPAGTGWSNTGTDAGQSVDHLHFHLLGGRKLTWPPG
jgi:histidine triad (HIT) family protein